jgi:hypothetical protein
MVRDQPGQKVSDIPISTNNQGVAIHACDPSYAQVMGRRTVVQG